MAKKSSPPPQTCLYSRADYDLLIAERRRLNDLIGHLDKMEACGIDCTLHRQMRSDIDKQLEAIQQNFMNPPPQY